MNRNRSFITWYNIINYTFDVDQHNFALTGLSSWTQSKFNSSYMEGTGQLVAEQLWHNIGANEKESYVIRSGYTQNQTMSYGFRANYSYQAKYLLTLSTHWDRPSILSSGHKCAML